MRRLVAISFAVLITVSGALHAQGVWSKANPAKTPGPRNGHGMVYDIRRGVVVMFGGIGANSQAVNETWEWNGTTWTQRTPSTSPPKNHQFGMVYDLRRGVTVVYGGVFFNTTWEWDGTNWKQRPTSIDPGSRCCMYMAYDSGRGKTVLFGGYGSTRLHNDTWEWDGTTWKQLQPTTSPGRRCCGGMAYDTARGVCVLFGGAIGAATGDTNETWEWDGTNWANRTPAKGPHARRGNGLLNYDTTRQRTVLFGGGTDGGGVPTYNDTWEWDGIAWAQRQTAVAPSPRYIQARTYDAARGRTVLFGGNSGSPNNMRYGDTWTYTANNTADFATYGTGCRGSAGIPTLHSPTSGPWIGQTFGMRLDSLPATGATAVFIGSSRSRWGTITLPLKLDPIGMTGCTLLTGVEVVFPGVIVSGRFDVSLPIPNSAGLAGLQFYGQGIVFDALANPAGATLSNGRAAVVGRL